MRLLQLGTALVSVLMAGTTAAARFSFDTTPGRLPKDVVPSHYALEFDLDPQRDAFSASAEIVLKIARPVEAIVLNARSLSANTVTLVDAAGAARPLSVASDENTQQWRLRTEPAAMLAAGEYRLRIGYEGKVERRGQALFRVDHTAHGQPARMLATQLEPIHARALFPSFDEPAFRATFDIAVNTASRYSVVSNMPATRWDEQADGRRRVQFARTPSMPSYLVALAVGEFDVVEDSFDRTPLRILTARGRGDEARYAMGVTKQVLGLYRDYFGIDYMLPKLDQLAIPGVRNGAMEDWGAISYAENVLLYSPQRSPPRQQETIFSLVAHEIAHQWFGNLVTAAWWDDIWLNEAFATWIAAKALHHFNPAWKAPVGERLWREEAMLRDAGTATRAVSEPPRHESGIFEVFDELTYSKGGAVLGMIEAWLGPEVFRDGLRRYLSAHRYSNASAADLWFHLSQAAGRDVTPIIKSWIDTPGVPLVRVKSACRSGRTEVELTQQRFSAQQATVATTWQVPMVLDAGGQKRRVLLGAQPLKASFKGCVPVVANGGDLGYYRVQNDSGNAARLQRAYARLPAVERIGLVADALALARAGYSGFDAYFALLDAARDETEAAIWQQVIDGYQVLDRTFADTPVQAALRGDARRRLAPVFARLGWEPRAGEDTNTQRLRAKLIEALGSFDDATTIARARVLFAGAQANPPMPLEPSLRSAVVQSVARHADEATFEVLRRLLREAPNQEDEYLYGGALIQVRDPKLVGKVLELSLTDEWKPGAASYYASQIGEASGRPEVARAFLLRHFAALRDKASIRSRAWLLPGAYNGFSDEAHADELLAEQQRLLGAEALGPALQVAAQIRTRAELREREGERLMLLLQPPAKPAAPPARKPPARQQVQRAPRRVRSRRKDSQRTRRSATARGYSPWPVPCTACGSGRSPRGSGRASAGTRDGQSRRCARTRRAIATSAHRPCRSRATSPSWILSLPIPLRLLLAAQPLLVTPVLQLVHRAITRLLLDQAGLKAEQADSGALTRIQRFGSAANLNIH
jgi:aminopeptidase N